MRASIKHDLVYIAWSETMGSLLEDALIEASKLANLSIRQISGLENGAVRKNFTVILDEGVGVLIVDRVRIERLNDIAGQHSELQKAPVIVIANEHPEDLGCFLRCHGNNLNYSGRIFIEEQAKGEALVPLVRAIALADHDERGRITPLSLRQALYAHGGDYIAYELPQKGDCRQEISYGLQDFLSLSRAYFNRGRAYSLA